MKNIVQLFVLGFVLMSCVREKGDAPLARGKGFGYEWNSGNQSAILRVSVQNFFTRDSVVALDGNGRHFELCVGPVRDAYMIVPKGNYRVTAWTFGNSVGTMRFDVQKDDRNGARGVIVKIHP
jgi:hypothetical protein